MDDELFSVIAEICPECVVAQGKGIKIMLDDLDPRVRRVQNVLEEAGWPRRELPAKLPPYSPNGYRLSTWCEYEESDYENFEYFGIGPPEYKPLEDADIAGDKNETICIELGGLDRHRGDDIIRADTFRKNFLVSARVRGLLQGADFIGLEFAEVWLVDKEGVAVPWLDHEPEEFWELRSSICLPAVSAKITLIDPAGSKPLPHGTRGPALYRGPLGKWLVYNEHEFSAVEPFDVAHTFETGSRYKHGTSLVFSKRFCDYLRQHEIKFGWAPVWIEDEYVS